MTTVFMTVKKPRRTENKIEAQTKLQLNANVSMQLLLHQAILDIFVGYQQDVEKYKIIYMSGKKAENLKYR